jgi:hypothetical protein
LSSLTFLSECGAVVSLSFSLPLVLQAVFSFFFFLLWFSSALEQLQLDLGLVLLSFPFSSFVEPVLSSFFQPSVCFSAPLLHFGWIIILLLAFLKLA